MEETYGWVEGDVSTYLTAGSRGRATLALRAGGKRMLGDHYPYFNAAAAGGGGFFSGQDAVRGLRPSRYIGDSAVFGNADLRLYLSRFFLALPGEWGLFGFGDVGRVWLDGETSDTWHTSYGRRPVDRPALAVERGGVHRGEERRAHGLLHPRRVQLLVSWGVLAPHPPAPPPLRRSESGFAARPLLCGVCRPPWTPAHERSPVIPRDAGWTGPEESAVSAPSRLRIPRRPTRTATRDDNAVESHSVDSG